MWMCRDPYVYIWGMRAFRGPGISGKERAGMFCFENPISQSFTESLERSFLWVWVYVPDLYLDFSKSRRDSYSEFLQRLQEQIW